MIKVGHTTFYKDAEFLIPFYRAALPLLPKSKRLITVRAIKVPLDKQPGAEGQCKTSDNRSYDITINIWNRKWRRDSEDTTWWKAVKHSRSDLEACIWTFAHELAHIREWEHTPRHWYWTCRFAMKFTKVLYEHGVRDTASPGEWKKFSKEA